MEGPSPKNSWYQAVPASEGEDDNHNKSINYGSPTGSSSFSPSSVSGSGPALKPTPNSKNNNNNINNSNNLNDSNHRKAIGITGGSNSRVNGGLENDENVDDNDDESNSLVVDESRSHASISTSRSVYRQSSYSDNVIIQEPKKPMEIHVSGGDVASSTAGGASSSGPRNNNNNTVRSATTSPVRHKLQQPQQLHTSSHHNTPNASRTSLSLSQDWDDDDFENDFDDEINVRRYQLDFTNMAAARDVPLPAEFQGHTWTDRLNYTIHQSYIVAHRNWQSLRQGARQRRAARLLTMPSESMRYRFRACFLSWCCDATDMGIALTAAGLVIWILVGLLSTSSSSTSGGTARKNYSYWLTGLALFLVRISARRLYDAAVSFVIGQCRRQQQQRQRGRLNSRQRFGSTDEDAPTSAITTDMGLVGGDDLRLSSWKTSRSDHGSKKSSNNNNNGATTALPSPV